MLATHSVPPSTAATPADLRSALIIDDHPLFCDALAMTLRAVVGITTIDMSERLETALSRLATGPRPDVIVLDLNLPDVNGLEGLTRLSAVVGGRPIVVVSSMADPRVVRAAMQAGAAGFVPKHSAREVFREAFDAIRAGQPFVPVDCATPDSPDPARPESSRYDPATAAARLTLLTRQQENILQLICAGKMNKQIAYELSIAETTVKAHVTAIMRKLGVQSRTQAVLMVQEARFSNRLPSGN